MTRRKLTASILTFLLILQTVIGIFTPINVSVTPPYMSFQETRAAGESWYDASWSRRKAITITENSGSTLTNYQVKITVPYDSDMQADFDDVRFTDEDGSTLIDHWLESKTDSTTADFWVEISSLTASSSKTIYVYYGNGSATSASNGDNTFVFFDDFEDGAYADKWTASSGTWTESGGVVSVAQAGGWGPYLITNNSIGTDNIAIESRAKTITNSVFVVNSRATNINNRWHTGLHTGSDAMYTFVKYGGSMSSVDTQNFTMNDNTYYIAKQGIIGQTVYSYAFDDNRSQLGYGTLTNTNTNTGDKILINAYDDATWDWIFVRNYASSEPTASSLISVIEELQSQLSLTNWTYRKSITINASKVENTDQTNFPVLINLTTDSDLVSHAQSDGDDILFTLNSTTWSSGTKNNKLAHEIEKYDSSTGELVAWVKIPTLSASANTTLYMYYGNSSATNQQNTIAVWDENYKMVQHLQETPTVDSNAFDSTNNNNDGAFHVSMDASDQVAGKIGGSLDFDGTGDYVRITNNSSFDFDANTSFTLSLWINKTSTGATDVALGKYNSTQWWIGTSSDGKTGNIYRDSNGVTAGSGTKTTNVSDGIWHQITAVVIRSAGTDNIKLYVDGELETENTTVNFTGTFIINADVYLATFTGSDYLYDGIIDEARISSTARSADWIATEYNNQNSLSAFYTLGEEEVWAIDHLAITGSSTQTAGASQTITITAKTNLGTTYTGYTGDKSITLSGANDSPNSTTPTCSDKDSNDIDLGTATTLTFTNGVATCDLKLYKTESAEIEGTDGTYTTAGDANDLNITVSSATLNNFLIDAPSSGTGSVPFSATITSRDAYNNTTTTVSGDTAISVNQSGSITLSTVADTEFTDDGIYTDNFTISNIEENKSVVITVTNGLSTGTDTITLTVIPAAPILAALSNITASSMSLSWTDNSSNETGFKIERSTDNITYTQIGTVSSDITTYTGSGTTSLDSYTTYYFRVRAYNTAGNSSYATVNDITLSAGGAFISPTPPAISLPQNQTSVFEITDIAENEVTINLSNVQNAYQVAVSTTPDFKYTSWELYEKNKTIDISNANKLYIKFRSKTGGVSKVIEIEINKDLESKKIPNGSLIKIENDYKVYIKKGNYLRHIPNPAIFSFYGHFKWDDIKTITKEKFNQYQTSILIRELNDRKVYQIQDNNLAKHHLNITAEQFTNSGRSWEMVYVVNKRERDYYEMGEDVEE